MRILLADDDRDVAEYVRVELEHEHFAVSVCHDGGAAWRTALHESFDLIVLDVMMPVMDGVEVTRRLRRDGVDAPILLLTARDAPADIVRGLDAGADDHLAKPFSFDVLLARLRARIRGRGVPADRVRFGDLVLDRGTHEVHRRRRRLDLTPTEFAVLDRLVRANGRVVSREALLAEVWGDRDVLPNTLEVFIRGLRTKLDGEGEPRLIQTARGIGYRLGSDPS